MSAAKTSWKSFLPKARALDAAMARDDRAWLADSLGRLPLRWSEHVRREHKRAGGLSSFAANALVTEAVHVAAGRLSLGSSDDELMRAAEEAAGDAAGIAGVIAGAGLQAGRALLEQHCERWGIEPPPKACMAGPAVARMCCKRWWIRRLRRALGRRCDGAAIRLGLVRRGLWVYASQDAVERRQAQRRRNARALENAVVECEASGESLSLAEVVAGSIANPEVKRAELMTRIKGCDAIATENGAACEFWTLTAPSEYHAMRVIGGVAVANPSYSGKSPKEGQQYLSKVWARARAAWKRRGLEVFGLRTAEPHHDGCPHWHLIAYGARRDLRFARRLLRVYAMRQNRDEPGAKEHRFKVLEAKAGTKGAAYAAKYVSKNIDGKGLEGDIDQEGQKKISNSVRRVDAWAATWGIRQFQFFGCPSISGWRVLRRMRGPVAVVGSQLERARAAADDSDFASYWRAAVAGGLSLIYRAADRLTAYGDAAAARIAGICEGARRAMLPDKVWAIKWKAAEAGAGFGFPRSCVNNCTGVEKSAFADSGARGVVDREKLA